MSKNISLWFLFLLIVSFLLSCQFDVNRFPAKKSYGVPRLILKKADNFVISKTGNTFFKKYISLDSSITKPIKEGFFIRYNYRRQEYPFVNEPIYFTLDSNGNILKKYGVVGIPNCLFEPEECEYKIDSAAAVRIGEIAKLPKGVKPWDVNFRWSSEQNRYVWHIIVTTKELGTGKNYKAEGIELLINPSDGEIIKKSKWKIF